MNRKILLVKGSRANVAEETSSPVEILMRVVKKLFETTSAPGNLILCHLMGWRRVKTEKTMRTK